MENTKNEGKIRFKEPHQEDIEMKTVSMLCLHWAEP